MVQNSNTGTQQQSQANPTSGPAKSGGNNMLIYAIGIIVVIIIIGIIFLISSLPSSPSVPAITQNRSANSTAIYLSPTQTQAILGSPLANYYTSDLFNLNSPANITDLEIIVPQIYGNVTSGWVTSAYGTNATANASIQYYVLAAKDPSQISSLLASNLTAYLNMTPSVVTPGTFNGFSYTYDLYENSTSVFQTVLGWKNGDVALVLIYENAGFMANETQLVDITANDTP